MDYESSSDEKHDEKFQKNGVSQCPLSPNPMDYESSSDEGQDEALTPNPNGYSGSSDKGHDVSFSVSKQSHFRHSPNSMDYESSTDNAHEEEYPINIKSNFTFSRNSKDYDSSIKEGEDEEYPPSQYLKSTVGHSADNIPLNDDDNAYTNDDPMMKMLLRNIVSRSRRRPFCINARCYSYTRGRVEYLTRRSSISTLISSECCQKYCLEHMDFKIALERRKRYLSMNKSMKNSYLVGCMQSTLSGYDYHIGSLFICKKAFKMFHLMGNFRLSIIQENLENDPTFYLEVRHKRQFGPLSNTAMSMDERFIFKAWRVYAK